MTHDNGNEESISASWRAQDLVANAVPAAIDHLRSTLPEIEADHQDNDGCLAAVIEVRDALERLSIALIRDAVWKASAHGYRRPGIRSTSPLGRPG